MTRGPTRRGAVGFVIMLLLTSVVGTAVGPVATVSGASKKADVVFVFDKTGSMDQQAAALKNEVENAAAELEASGIDARYALVTYEGADNTEIRTPLTSDTQALKDALDFTTEGGTENASHGIQTALDRDFRDDAQKIVVVITDEDDDGTEAARTQAVERLNAEDGCLAAVSPATTGPEELRTMAEQADCGRWTDIESESFTDVVTDLVDIIEEVTDDEPTETVSGPDFEVVETAVESSTTSPGEAVNVTFTVENRGSSGTYDALVTTMGEIHYDGQMEIESDESTRFTATVTLDDLGNHKVRLNHRAVAEITVERPPPEPLDATDVELRRTYPTRSTVVAGESYSIVSVVENVGNESGQATVEFHNAPSMNATENGTIAATKTVVLAPGERATLRHNTTANNGSTNASWAVAGSFGENETHAGNLTILGADEVDSGVVDVYATPRTISPGETYEVAAVVHNADDDERLFVLTFGTDDGDEKMTMQWVNAGTTVEVTRTYTAPTKAGTANVTVNDKSTEVVVGSST